MLLRKIMILGCILVLMTGFVSGMALAKKPSLDAWKPKFDPKGAKYKFIVSNVSHPVLKGVYAGFAIRDELWKRTNGQMYLDYKPFSMLGGEVEVLNQLQMGAIQGMSVSSVVPRFGASSRAGSRQFSTGGWNGPAAAPDRAPESAAGRAKI